MPRTKNVDLAAELGEDMDLTEEQANAARAPKARAPEPVAVVSPAPATPALSPDVVALMTAFVNAQMQASTTQAESMAAIMDRQLKVSQNPGGRHSVSDAEYPAICALNPLGDKNHPRPGLKCEFFLGVTDPKGQIQRSFPWVAEDLSVFEQIALNTLEPGESIIRMRDESEIMVTIVPVRDALNQTLQRMIVVVPLRVIEKKSQSKNDLPSITNIVAQITGHDYSKLKGDDLAWFMAEHRAGRYVKVRETVAA